MGREVPAISAGYKSLRCHSGVSVMIAVSKNDLLPQNASPSRLKLTGTHSATLFKHIATEQIQGDCFKLCSVFHADAYSQLFVGLVRTASNRLAGRPRNTRDRPQRG